MRINAYVSERQRERRKRRMYFFGTAAVFVAYFIFAGVAWFILRSPFFRVDQIVVEGNSVVSKDDIVSLLQESALRNHSFIKAVMGFKNMLMWPTSVATSDLVFFPNLASIATTKDYFSNTLTVNVTERVPFGVWCYVAGNDQCYWFDNQGTIFGRAFASEGNAVFSVTDDSQRARGLNQKILPNEFIANFISILQVLRESGLTVKNIELKNLDLEQVNVVTAEGPLLYFSLRFPANNYLPVLKSMMTRSGFAKIGYIDCTTENRIYYK